MGSSSSEECVSGQLEELQKQLGKKQKFEEAVSSLRALLQQSYPSASPPLRQKIYAVVCRVATVLRTRYTAPGFWHTGIGLFEQAETLVSKPSEKEHLRSCISQAREHLHLAENPAPAQNNANRGYLFEGHLTVDPEPPRPQWLVQSDLMNAVATLAAAESSHPTEERNLSENTANLLEELIQNFEDSIPEILEDVAGAPRAPPASKKVVAKLPVITLTEEILAKMGKGAECAICREDLQVNDKMQELPCKHTFHPPCLKPWLDEHNSCPICRHELQTDDHAYESWKEQEREAKEERKGAANAVRGGEYMYV
ncbi:E3 ubiquitin-protein ligase AIP2 [Punica granatum]|uniref:RING-type E3 ubiquitin transferase n=2 Tax=Punica granatum TaxID=22663 RepID=A0A218XHZ7_PUNGR|nr:E3 ubiquitin-protein ligase AIP2 [Punica granatum]OWM84081.1 hypothetical protein CDL15_Pgr009328 [Punica granatum]PKI76014.1 hypothetical protein CRG98_003564 [Punica granatum]